jgi:predicted small lipoprotein YifL
MDTQLNPARLGLTLVRAISAVGMIVLLAGCGQPGPLYLPAAPAPAASAAH